MTARVVLPILFLALAAGGCRSVGVATDAGATYAVEVNNRTGAALQLSFEGSEGERALGTVQPGATERFIVVTPAPTVTLVGTAAGFTVRETVTLEAGRTIPVVLRR